MSVTKSPAFRRPPKDPKMRRNHTCIQCSKPLPPVSITHDDPFCSNACCREFYQVDISKGPVAK